MKGGNELLGVDTFRAFGRVFTQEVQGEIFGGIAGACARLIFLKADIQDPVQTVFDAQWERTARCKILGLGSDAAKEVAVLGGALVPDLAGGLDHPTLRSFSQ